MAKSITARVKAYRFIKQAILKGEFSPGSHLRTELLTEMIGVSRTPIRQALTMLTDEGYVLVNDNKRSHVMDVDEYIAEETFDLLIKLEGYSAGLAAKKISTAALDELEALHRHMQQVLEEEANPDDEFLDLNAQFHDKIHLSSGNKQLYEMIKKIVNFPTIIYLKFNQRTESDESVHHHGEIVQALRNRDQNWQKHSCVHILPTSKVNIGIFGLVKRDLSLIRKFETTC